MDKKQRVVIGAVLIIFFISLVVSELKLWDLICLKLIWELVKFLILAPELLALCKCVQLYRVLNNSFFKFQGIALALSAANDILKKLTDMFFAGLVAYVVNPTYHIVRDSINAISLAIGLAGILLALYALLQYRERWEQQTETASPVNRFYDLIPYARDKKTFLLIITGIPLLLYGSLLLGPSSFGMGGLFHLMFSVMSLSAELLCLLLSLALVKAYGNNLFKFLFVVYTIPLGVMILSFLNLDVGFFLFKHNVGWLSALSLIFNYIVMFHRIIVAGLLVYALFAYRESR
ncbi:MAG: hypothetical protein A4E53_00691 [Pelotomaculum sp. PtaB.Bin104]|nr:MAG: hypothetical protein A4E53_00691 [Pelotomaculum sp. PtaB.Bin104]